jgi:hypothetical protein
MFHPPLRVKYWFVKIPVVAVNRFSGCFTGPQWVQKHHLLGINW